MVQCLVKKTFLKVFFKDFNHKCRTITLQNSFLHNTYLYRATPDECFCSLNKVGRRKMEENKGKINIKKNELLQCFT